MKTYLTFLALATAVATPAAFLADLTGFDLPAALDSSHLLAAFVVTVLVLTVFADYRHAPRALAAVSPRPALAKAPHPLAA
jgi:hypothetical protein